MPGMEPLSDDLIELIGLFKSHEVEFLVVGAHALAFHAFPRQTYDLDLWIRRSEENTRRVRAALDEFGIAIGDSGEAQLQRDRNMIVIGVEPNQVDVLNFLDGCEFGTAFRRRATGLLQGIEVPFLSLEDYVATKRASGRVKDLRDLDDLRRVIGRPLPDES